MNDPHRYVGAPTFAASNEPARDDAELLSRIGQGDEDAMAAFYRPHGRVVFAQVLLVTGQLAHLDRRRNRRDRREALLRRVIRSTR